MIEKEMIRYIDSQRLATLRRAGAELIGTYALVTVGCGAIIVHALTGTLTTVGIAVTFGLIVMVMISVLGHISGAHFNPAVTMALAWMRHFPWRDVPLHIGSQMLGAVLGALTLRVLFGDVANLGATVPQGSLSQSFGLEVLLTAVLMFVIATVRAESNAPKFSAMMIGATVTLDALWGGSISGASMNPARSFGPACVAGVWQAHWIYWLGPMLGAGLGVLLYQFLNPPPRNNTIRKVDPGSLPLDSF